jgi:CopG antitoxin of type II toxin-antitoxin system
MAKNKTKRDPIPEQFKSISQAAEFWDTHSLADYWDLTRAAQFKVNIKHRRYLVALEPKLLKQVSQTAEAKGISPETLINIWISEKLHDVA